MFVERLNSKQNPILLYITGWDSSAAVTSQWRHIEPRWEDEESSNEESGAAVTSQ